MEKHEIITTLQKAAQYHYNEAKRYEDAAALINTESKKLDTNSYPDYSKDWDAIEKFQYFENIAQRFWAMSKLKEFLIRAEGEATGSKSFTNLKAYTSKLLSRNKLIRMKYNNANLYAFYTTNLTWIEKVDTRFGIKYRPIDKHAPNPTQLQNLDETQKSPEQIVWDGLTE